MKKIRPFALSEFVRWSAVVVFFALTATAGFGQGAKRSWNEIVGKKIVDSQGVEIGVISDTAVDLERGRFFGLVVSYGGFLGIGSNERIVPPGAFSDRGVPNSLQLNMTKSAFRSAPEMKLSRGSGPPDTVKASALYRHFGQQPYFTMHITSTPSADDQPGQLGYIAKGSKVLFLPVDNLRGKPLGVVRSLWDLDSSTGRFSGVVITPTAFDAAGGRKIVPPQALRYNPRRNRLRISNREESFNDTAKFAFHPGSEYTSEEPMRPGIPPPPLVHGNSRRDKEITEQISRRIRRDGSLSHHAEHVHIATVKGIVSMRGRVENTAERNRIAAYAGEVAGRGNVVDQIEVKAMTAFDHDIDRSPSR